MTNKRSLTRNTILEKSFRLEKIENVSYKFNLFDCFFFLFILFFYFSFNFFFLWGGEYHNYSFSLATKKKNSRNIFYYCATVLLFLKACKMT